MNLTKTKEFVVRYLPIIEPTGFFVVYYLFVWLVIHSELIYYMSGRMFNYYPFVMDHQFLYESLTMVGGPISYLTGFLAQCFYVSWIGALILTVLAWLFWFLSKRMFAFTKTNCIIELCYILPILLLAKYAMYSPLLLIDLSLLAVLAAFVIYLWADLSKSLFTIVLFLAELACLYYLIGGTVFLFGFLVAVYELLVKKQIALAGVFSVSLVVYVAGIRFFWFFQNTVFSVDVRSAISDNSANRFFKVSPEENRPNESPFRQKRFSKTVTASFGGADTAKNHPLCLDLFDVLCSV
ncbi:MAG: hypothetical protein JW912_03200 [Sedimentisphaerales bacterium]|nr:hypothetical protein [Sedimentisphaerales bacterium]